MAFTSSVVDMVAHMKRVGGLGEPQVHVQGSHYQDVRNWILFNEMLTVGENLPWSPC
jgi:hypothetical protein